MTDSTQKHTESEFKLRAKQTIEIASIDAALQELGQHCRLSQTRRHTDTYLDDNHSSLLRAGVGLRVRDSHSERRLTCKARKQQAGSLFVRDELEVDWPHDALPQSVLDLPPELQAAIEPLVHNRQLVPQQSLSVLREVRMLTDGDQDLCELAIDFVVAQANGHSVMFQEIELEVLSNVHANEQLAKRLHQLLPVEFATHDKPSHAATLLGMDPPAAQSGEDRALAPIGESVPLHLKDCWFALQELQTNPDAPFGSAELRTLRQHYRSMRNLMQMFDGLWSTETTARLIGFCATAELKFTAAIDGDALLAALEHQLAAMPAGLSICGVEVAQWLQQQRDQAHARLQEWLGHAEQQTSQQQFERDVQAVVVGSEVAQQQLLRTAPERLLAAVEQLRNQLDQTRTDLPATQLEPLLHAVQLVHDLAEQFSMLPCLSYKKSLKAIARAERQLTKVWRHEQAANQLIEMVANRVLGSSQQGMHAAVLGSLATLHGPLAIAAREAARDALERLNRDRVWRRFSIQ